MVWQTTNFLDKSTLHLYAILVNIDYNEYYWENQHKKTTYWKIALGCIGDIIPYGLSMLVLTHTYK